MNALSKLLEVIDVNFCKISIRKVVKPFQLNGYYEQKNILVYLNKGHLAAGQKYTVIPEGAFYFLPVDQPVYVKQGKGPDFQVFDQRGFETREERRAHLREISVSDDLSLDDEVFTLLAFDLSVYKLVSFFSILEMPGFAVPADKEIAALMHKLLLEEGDNRTAKEQMQQLYTRQIVIRIFRHLETIPEFASYLEKASYLLDKRLINIIQYVQGNLEKDLSNKVIATIAYVSEDYVGQFFKTLTGKNLQEYIENQRLEKAHYILTTQNGVIQDIAYQVGFKDPAYFSRRFKMKYSENAIAVRKRNRERVL